jgi:hypothetical protein
MTNLQEKVCDFLFRKRLSSTETARRLGISHKQVMELAVPTESKESHFASDPIPSTPSRKEGPAQIEFIRRRVREALIERLDEFPPASLVRLWQLIEDPKLLLNEDREEEDLFQISEETREKIFALLDAEGRLDS